MLNKEISYIAKFNGKGESYQNGVIVKETKKAVLAYFYFSGMMRDYNFAMWIPKSRIKGSGEKYTFTANLHVFTPYSKGFSGEGKLDAETVIEKMSKKQTNDYI